MKQLVRGPCDNCKVQKQSPLATKSDGRWVDYDTYLRSPHWQDVRRRYWGSEEPHLAKECICGETENLQLHHMTYERVGRERLEDLTPLCPTCHNMIHVLVDRGELGLDFRGFIDSKRAERYAEEEKERPEEVPGDTPNSGRPS